MDYFVSIENTAYDLWQIELLIESFKLHNLQDSLLIGIAGESVPLAKNLTEHKRKMCHEIHPFNSIYSVYAALYTGLLTEPFVLLHPDMLLLKPFQDDWKENIVFEPHKNDLKTDYPFMVGGAIRFDLVSHKLFRIALAFASQFTDEKTEEENDIVKAAWTATIAKAWYCDVIGEQIAAPLWYIDNIDNISLIHYKTGLPPIFNKKLFFRQITITDKNPYQTLLQENPNHITNYVHKVIHSYQGDL